jgi:hypothetical protein
MTKTEQQNKKAPRMQLTRGAQAKSGATNRSMGLKKKKHRRREWRTIPKVKGRQQLKHRTTGEGHAGLTTNGWNISEQGFKIKTCCEEL